MTQNLLALLALALLLGVAWGVWGGKKRVRWSELRGHLPDRWQQWYMDEVRLEKELALGRMVTPPTAPPPLPLGRIYSWKDREEDSPEGEVERGRR